MAANANSNLDKTALKNKSPEDFRTQGLDIQFVRANALPTDPDRQLSFWSRRSRDSVRLSGEGCDTSMRSLIYPVTR